MPKVIAIKRTNFTVTWSPPSILGGCPVTSYVLLRDDGNGSEVNIKIDPDQVQNRPYLFLYEVQLHQNLTGKEINIKVAALNVMGNVTSRATLLTLSDVPSKPFPAPTVD